MASHNYLVGILMVLGSYCNSKSLSITNNILMFGGLATLADWQTILTGKG